MASESQESRGRREGDQIPLLHALFLHLAKIVTRLGKERNIWKNREGDDTS